MTVVVEDTEAGSVVSGYLGAPSSALDDGILVTGDSDLVTGFSSWRTGTLIGCDVEFDTRSTVRPRSGDGTSDVFIVGTLLSGSATFVSTEGSNAIAPSSVLVYPAMVPFYFEFEGPFHYSLITVTAAELGVTSRALQRLAGRVQIQDSPFSAALVGILGSARPASGTLGDSALASVGESAMHMLRQIVALSDHDHFAARSDHRIGRVLEWIDEHLTAPDLTPDVVAAELHMSLRQLHRLFGATDFTCGQYVLDRRLQRIRDDIPRAGADVSLTEIAARWGVLDASHFSKAFRRRFGLSPREYRRLVQR